MNPYLSIIPIYNSKLHIQRCINSVSNQTYTNFETIYSHIFITPQKDAKLIFETYFLNKNLISKIYIPIYTYENDVKTIVWKNINYV
jgi:glycosyltransferase involved in cell wall biosynthesis